MASRSAGHLSRLLVEAPERRTIGAVVQWKIEGLRPRRWRAGGLPRGLERRTGMLLPEVAPLDIVRIANGVVSAKRENNVKDGTPGGGDMPADSGGAGTAR